MFKYFKRVAICGMIAGVLWIISLSSKKQSLQQEVIPLPMISDFEGSQAEQLVRKVRKAVLESVQEDMKAISDTAAARDYLSQNLTKIQDVVNNTLSVNGYPESSRVNMVKEIFDKRQCETFSLPAGVYDSLRIILGSEGRWMDEFENMGNNF